MSSATPFFLVTDAGLAAASVATPTGPYVHITSFKIGSAYGYTPQRSDTDINGNLLYEGVPTSYQNIGNNTLDVVLQIPPDAGPFDFGEVAVFLDGGVMFAKAVFDSPQTKFSSLGTNVVSSYTLHCLIKLQQSIAIFQIDTNNGPPAVWEVDKWSDVYPPGVSANPDIPLTLVRELDGANNSSLLTNSSDAKWTVGTNYDLLTKLTVTNSTTTWIECSAAGAGGYINFLDSMLSAANREYVLETPDGFFRSVSAVTKNGANYHFALNPDPLLTAPAIGSVVTVYKNNSDGNKIFYSQIVDPPSIPLATVGNPGLAYGSSGLYMPSPGVIQTFGLLHSPATNTGRILTSSDSLGNITLPSGVYSTNGGAYGLPLGMPVPWDGQIFITMPSPQNIIQTYYPIGSGNGDASGVGGYPIYWRSYNTIAGVWTVWNPLSSGGRGASVMAGGKGASATFQLATGIWNVMCWAYTHSNTYPANQLYINGVMVDYTADHGDPEGTGYTSMFGHTQINVPSTGTYGANANWADTTGDYTIQVLAVPA